MLAIVLILFGAVSGAMPASIESAPDLDARRQEFRKLLDEQWEYVLSHSPEFASILGDKRWNDKLSDLSVDAILADQAMDRVFFKKFEVVDATGFPEQEALTRTLLVRGYREAIEDAHWKNWEMPVTQIGGIHLNAPQLVSLLSFSTVKDYDDYAARLKGFPRQMSDVTDGMRRGMADRLMPPKFLLAKVADQCDGIAAQKPEDSPFAVPLSKMPDSFSPEDRARLRQTILDTIRDAVVPAYARFARFVREENWKALNAAIGKDAKRHFHTREEILAGYRQFIDRMKPQLPKLFGRLPKADVIVLPVEEFREKEASGAQYNQGTPDGSRPGHVMVNTADPESRKTISVESTSYHEGVPGHHLQISIAQELEELPPVRQQAFYTAFVEGWALYSERLGKEIGFYEDPYSDFGRLQDEMLRAIRLVVDTGLHAKKWTRQQVVDFFHAHSAIDEVEVQTESDRYISDPGQALAYMMGQLKILELRDRAQKELGPRFDIRGFHDTVLDAGALPLDVLEIRVNGWIAAAKTRVKSAG